MKLIDYMRSNDLDDEAMAGRVGIVTAHAIRKLKYGERKPSLAVAVKIEEVTAGAVPAAHWVRETAPSQQVAA
jgi:hypothetical protein